MSETFRYKWVRTEFQGAPDNANIQKHLSRGWTPVPVGELPDFMLSEAAANGGLTPYRMPEESHNQLTGAMFAASVKAENWAAALPAGIQNYSDDAKEAIMCKLEDFYSPSVCAQVTGALAEANALRRQLGQPERTLKQERRDALAYYGKKWPESTNWGRNQMRDYRVRFRMPKGLSEWAEMLLGDARKLLSSN